MDRNRKRTAAERRPTGRGRPIAGTQPGQEQAIQRHRGQTLTGTAPRQRRKSRPPGPSSRRITVRSAAGRPRAANLKRTRGRW